MLAPRQRPSIPPVLAMKLLLNEVKILIEVLNSKVSSIPCNVSVLYYELTVGLLDVDVYHGCVLSHVEEDSLLKSVDPLLVLPKPGLGQGVPLTAPGLRHSPHLTAQTRVSLLQGIFH